MYNECHFYQEYFSEIPSHASPQKPDTETGDGELEVNLKKDGASNQD